MAKYLEAPCPYVIVKESDGRFYHKRINAGVPSRMPNDLVYLTESAYNLLEEQRLIELDENSRGQPPPKKLKHDSTPFSFLGYPTLTTNKSYTIDEVEDVETGTTKPSNVVPNTSLSNLFVKKTGNKNLSLETIPDEDIMLALPQRKSSTSNHKLLNQRRDRQGGLSISEIFDHEFSEEKSEFFSHFKFDKLLSSSSLLSEVKPERKASLLDKIKKFTGSGQNLLKSKKESEIFWKKSSIKINVENSVGESMLEILSDRNLVTKEQSKLSNSFPEASALQDHCKGIISSVFHQVKSKLMSTKQPFNNKVFSSNSCIHSDNNNSSEVQINIDKTDSKVLNMEPKVPTSDNTLIPREIAKTSAAKVNIPAAPVYNVVLNSSTKPSEMSYTSIYLNTSTNLNSYPETHIDSADSKTENEEYEDCYYSETEESENSYSENSELDSEIEIVPSSYEVPRKHCGRKEQIKRDQILMENLKRHFDGLREEKSKKKSKLGIFQKLVNIFSRRKDSPINSERKEKLTFRERLRKRLGLKISIKSKHNNSVVIYREKRRKLFHEQKEFFEDSIIAYSKVTMPVYHTSNKVANDEIESPENFPFEKVIACTVSDGVVHERKRKLGQSRIGTKRLLKDVANDNESANQSVTITSSTSDIRGILKNK